MQHAADEVEAHAGRRFGASTAARRRSGAACDRAVVAHRQLVRRRFRRTHRRAVWRRRRADPLSRPRGGNVILNALMGLPPVVAGLAIYLLLSRSGPLGSWGLLFTPTAMIIAQTVLVTPIIAALTRQTIEDLWREYRDELTAMNVGPFGRVATLIWDGRFSLVVTLLAGFGRAAAEVGAIIIVGGNINGYTRTMTTAIALETSKGDLPLAMGLGAVLITIVIAVNALAWLARRTGERIAG